MAAQPRKKTLVKLWLGLNQTLVKAESMFGLAFVQHDEILSLLLVAEILSQKRERGGLKPYSPPH